MLSRILRNLPRRIRNTRKSLVVVEPGLHSRVSRRLRDEVARFLGKDKDERAAIYRESQRGTASELRARVSVLQTSIHIVGGSTLRYVCERGKRVGASILQSALIQIFQLI